MSWTSFISNSFGRWGGDASPAVITREDDFPDVSDAPLDSRRLIRDRRYCQVLAKQVEVGFDDVSVECAWRGLHHEMALVPAGTVSLMHETVVDRGNGFALSADDREYVNVDSFYLDRHCTSNADYLKFIKAGGYENVDLWPQDILPWVLQFVDTTGATGPRFWADGQPPEGKLDHPVVGVCWYEANAYARWSGKRLPTTAEWQRAGTWSNGQAAEGFEQRYPWGNGFKASRANLWRYDHCRTIPVHELEEGSTPNGVCQLIGNVWEWVDAAFSPAAGSDVQVILKEAMAEVRGGAFDTYFPSHATCQFRSGQPILNRPENVGFRCCASLDDLRDPHNDHFSDEVTE